ncbi:hypothetical protein D3C84_38560 [compost metagenome]
MMSLTLVTAATTPSMLCSARCTSWAPSSICREELTISPRISFEASAERLARLRTSLATTAKPRP